MHLVQDEAVEFCNHGHELNTRNQGNSSEFHRQHFGSCKSSSVSE